MDRSLYPPADALLLTELGEGRKNDFGEQKARGSGAFCARGRDETRRDAAFVNGSGDKKRE